MRSLGSGWKEKRSKDRTLGHIHIQRLEIGEGNGYHSSILAKKSQEPGGLQSVELQRVGRDLLTV